MLTIRVLGEFKVRLDDAPISITRRHAQQLLACLLLERGKSLSRESLAEMLWSNLERREQRAQLRGVLLRLDRSLGSRDYIVRTADRLAFNPVAPHTLDVAELLDVATADPGSLSTETLLRIASDYRPLLPEFDDEWIVQHRSRLEDLYETKVLPSLLNGLAKERRWEQVLTWGKRTLDCAANQGVEPLYVTLMLAYYALGNLRGVSDTYERLQASLDEMGLEPSKATRDLYGRMVRGEEPRPAPENKPDRKAVLTLPPELAHPPTPFIGRVQLLKDVGEAMADPNTQLITLLGIGGIGKTRLATQSALQQSGRFADGVCLVPLETVRTPDAFFAALSEALKFAPYGQENLKTQVLNFLREKSLLLILDNFESLFEAATAGQDIDGPALVEELCVKAPQVKVLVTSRQSLDLRRETVVDVDGLDVPTQADAPEAAKVESVVLFELIARRVNQRFDLSRDLAEVVRICQLVSGTPLAVEIAAALVRGLTCAQIAERIQGNLDALIAAWRDVPPRQRSLRAVLEYAWSLLAPNEQLVFRQLSVFMDGFTHEAAAYVTGATYTTLRGLLDCALIRQESSGRFQIHSFVRQFGAEKLALSGEESATRARMAAFFLAHARANAEPERYKQLEPEWVNLLAGMASAHAQQQRQDVLAYADALSEAWYTYARYGDIRQSMPWATAAGEALQDEKAQARLLSHWGRACVRQGDYAEAAAHFERGLALAWKLIDSPSIARILYEKAQLLIERAELKEADELLDQCLEIYEELNDSIGLVESLRQKARVQYNAENDKEAELFATRARKLCTNDTSGKVLLPLLRLQADIASRLKNYGKAKDIQQEAFSLLAEFPNYREEAALHYSISMTAWHTKNMVAAQNSAQKSIKFFRDIGDRKSAAYVLILLGYIDLDLENALDASQHLTMAIDWLCELGDQSALIRPLFRLAEAYRCLDDLHRARWALKEVAKLAVSFGHPLTSLILSQLKDLES